MAELKQFKMQNAFCSLAVTGAAIGSPLVSRDLLARHSFCCLGSLSAACETWSNSTCRGLTRQPATRTRQPLTPSSSPAVGWRGEWNKVKLTGGDKDNLIRQQGYTNKYAKQTMCDTIFLTA